VIGGFGNDSIVTGDAADIIFGNPDGDTIGAGDGANLIFGVRRRLGPHRHRQRHDLGNEGNDTFVGGTGADRYVFLPGSGNARIVGFDAAAGDRLDLTGQTAIV
jgi:Ca2+-binding RTX toxin-like protein